MGIDPTVVPVRWPRKPSGGTPVPASKAGGGPNVWQIMLREDVKVADDRAWREHVKAERPVLGRIAAAVTPKTRG